MLEGDTIKYFGANIPVNLAVATIAEIILVGGAEYYRSTNKSPLGSVGSLNLKLVFLLFHFIASAIEIIDKKRS